MVRALDSHQYDPGSNTGVDAICGLSLLLVLSLAPRGFSPGTPVFPPPQKPTFPNSNSIWNARTRLNVFSRTLNCFVGKKIQPTYVITLGYQTISSVNTNFFVSIFYIAQLSCHLFQPPPHVFSSALKCLPRLSASFQLWS